MKAILDPPQVEHDGAGDAVGFADDEQVKPAVGIAPWIPRRRLHR